MRDYKRLDQDKFQSLKSPTLRPRRERWKQVMQANRALVKLHRPIPRAVDVTDYRIIDQFQLNHQLRE